MQISLESIQEVEDPYQAFVDSIKSPDTFRKYRNHLHRFLNLIPNKVIIYITQENLMMKFSVLEMFLVIIVMMLDR
ncbi:MAG: hypothetical protein KC440_06890 [Nitrosarchaeum sp.]|nr:hypothetical protein [Nitrosarchaeum sp.]